MSEIKITIRTGTSERSPLILEESERIYSNIEQSYNYSTNSNISTENTNETIHTDDIKFEIIAYYTEPVSSFTESKNHRRIFLNTHDRQTEQNDTQIECSICKENFKLLQTVSFLPFCNHVFHKNCLKQWVTYKQTCPLCRSEIPILER